MARAAHRSAARRPPRRLGRDCFGALGTLRAVAARGGEELDVADDLVVVAF
jgi:hypothetical protein